MYAKFSSRVIAAIIDFFIVVFIISTLLIVMLIICKQTTPYFMHLYLMNDIVLHTTFLISVLMSVVVTWLYYSFFESSNMKATIGKAIMGIEVVGGKYEQITFVRASARYWCKYISNILFMTGNLMPLFTRHKQALHDKISGTYVVYHKLNIRGKIL